jgi:hypothetical protein
VEGLLDTMIDFSGDVFRNIVSLRESRDLFADLADGDSSRSRIAAHAEMRVKEDIPGGFLNRGFHYTTAINYPDHEPYLTTRYGTGDYGVWYGPLELDTSIHETCYHMLRGEEGVEGLRSPIIRERAVYLVGCQAVLIDLRGKKKGFPWLVANDHGMTQTVGGRLQREGHPGLLAPSARCVGTNLAAFTPEILSNPRHRCYLTYQLDLVARKISVERQSGEQLYNFTYP